MTVQQFIMRSITVSYQVLKIVFDTSKFKRDMNDLFWYDVSLLLLMCGIQLKLE